jgi:hypothetical protein
MPRRSLIPVIGVLAALLGLISWRLRGPEPVPADAPTDQFSSARAIAVLSDLLKEGMPHPVGSPLNRTIRERIERRFRDLGYKAEVQRDFVCNATPACATVENVFAYPPGSEGPWVVFLAHYDSVGAGPGASDDGVGTAALLEVARALGAPSNVAFLITDGEEAGLLGAEAFVKSPWKDRVSIVVNVEHRGTSGPSFLFETSRGNAGLMRTVRSPKRPAASSLFYTIYEMLPNDTDVTVFKKAGVAALNFGAIGDVWYYHTPLDDLAHVNPRTVQHHGENLLASARALQPGFHRTQHNATFFDVLNLFLVSWPEGWTVWIAVASLVLLMAGLRGQSWRAIAVGAGLTALAIVIASIIGFALTFVAHSRAGSAGRLATPEPVLIAMWLAGTAAAVLAFSISRATDRRGLFSGAGLVWNVSALALAIALPGAAFLVLVPAVAFALCLVARANPLLTTMITSATAALVLFPLALFLYPALGKTSLAPIAALIALVFTTVAPWVQPRSRRLGAGLVFLAAAAAATTLAFPTYTAERPRRASIDHELPAPTVSAIVNRSGDVATIRVSSERNADRLMIEFAERVDVLRVNSVAPAPPNRDRVWRGALTVYATEATIEVRGREGVAFTATDLTYGLPEEQRDTVRQRISENGVPTHRGDVTLSSVKGRI